MRRCQILAVPQGDGMVDLMYRQRGTNAGTVTGGSDQFIGPTANVNTSTTTDIEFGNRAGNTYNQVTIAAVLAITALPAATTVVFSDNVPNTSGTCIRLTSAGQFNCQFNATGVTNTNLSCSAGDIVFCAFSGRVTGGTPSTMTTVLRKLNSKALGVMLNSSAISAATSSNILKISQQSATTYFHGNIGWILQSYTFLPLSTMTAWAEDPWDVFGNDTPRQGRLFAMGGIPIAANYSSPIEDGASILSGLSVPVEESAATIRSVQFNSDWGQSLVTASLGLLEFGQSLQASYTDPNEQLSSIGRNGGSLTDWLGTLTSDAKASEETGQAEQISVSAPIEPDAALQGIANSQSDWIGTLRSDAAAPEESGASVRKDEGSSVDFGQSLRRDSTSPLEASAGLGTQITVPIEFGGSAASILIDATVQLEWGASLSKNLFSPAEMAAAVNATSLILATVSANLSVDGALPEEFGQFARREIGSAVETLTALFANTPGQTEFSVRLSSNCVVQIAFDGVAITVLVFDPEGALIGLDRKAVIVGEDRKAAIIGIDRKMGIVGH